MSGGGGSKGENIMSDRGWSLLGSFAIVGVGVLSGAAVAGAVNAIVHWWRGVQ